METMETSRPLPSEPEILKFQARVDAIYPPDSVSAPIEQQRAWYDALCQAFNPPHPPGLVCEDGAVAATHGAIPTRRYRPAETATATTVVYLHGGGFVLGGLDSHDSICAELAHDAQVELIAVDYRLSPENPYPAAIEDARAALTAIAGEGRAVVVAGDSAGGNLAAGLALYARDTDLPVIGQVLIYPGLGGDMTTGSYPEMADTLALTMVDLRFYRNAYGADPDDVYAHPLRAETLAGLAPAYVTAAHFDPLRDDARGYAARLAREGVDVEFREEPQMVHAWLRARHTSPGAGAGFRALTAAVARLARCA